MCEHHGVDAAPDDWLSAAAIGSLAFIATTLAHEALGHGSVCLALGGRLVIHPVSMQCSVASSLLVLAGPAANAVLGLILLIVLRSARSLMVSLRYFFWLTMAFSLFNAAGYFCLGVMTGFGDWGVYLGPLTLGIKLLLAPIGGLLYYGSMHLVAWAGDAFLGNRHGRMLTVPPYLAAGIVACTAAALSPLGSAYIWVAVAASFGAGLGLLAIHDWGASGSAGTGAVLQRSPVWLVTSAVISLVFVIFIGRGLALR